MKTTIIKCSNLYEKIYKIIESAFSKDISNLTLTITQDEDSLDISVEIEDTTSDLFKSEEYSKLINSTRILLFDYFFGLAHLQIDEEVTEFISLGISDIDSELIDSVFSSSIYSVNDHDTLCAYEFSNYNSYNLVYIDNYNSVDEEDVSSGEVLYTYIELCIGNNKIVSFSEWVDEQYSSEISDLRRELSRYKESNYYDYHDAHERLQEDDYFFPEYGDFGESQYDNYSNLVNDLYSNNKISEQIKDALFSIDEDGYISIKDEILSECDIDLKSNGIPNAERYLTIGGYIYTGFMYIENSEIQKWGEEYNCYDWLTEDKLDELINETGSDLDAYDIWQIYTGRVRYDYEKDIDFDCYVYISYDTVLKIIENADLRYGVRSDDNSVWEEEEEE